MKCPTCNCDMYISARHCDACGIAVNGHFYEPRLARLAPDMQRLSELFIQYNGNLKDLAPVLDISYPTLRKRMDMLIEDLRQLYEADQQQIATWLKMVERGEMTAEGAARRIREINGES